MNLLFVLPLAADLLTPFLIWKGILPAPTRWVSHAALVTMIIGAYARMMVFDRIPRVVWVLAWVSAIGIGVALLQGQSILATAWGWWMMFQYPLVGLYAYLEPRWPERFPQRLRTSCTAILAIQVIIQILQYLTGEPLGDNLAGTFGEHGSGTLLLFVLFVLSLALGQWLARRQWKTLVLVLALASVSSALGAMKLFPFAVLALGMLSIIISIFRGRQVWKLVLHAVLIGAVVWIFFGLYDALVVPARGTNPLSSYLEPRTLADYLGALRPSSDTGRYSGRYHMGRNYALTYGWNAIRRDTTTLLFGLGLGARGESRTLGSAGVALLRGDVGLSTGTSLLVMMQELGLVGMLLLGGFILWAVVTIFKDIRSDPKSDARELRYALLLFSLLWPLWLWYGTAWVSRVPMLLYWAALGYVLSEPQRHHLGVQKSHIRSLSFQYCQDTEP